MGWSFRKSIRIGPVLVNLSRRGVGGSLGVKGLRTGIDARGRRYTRTTIPGIGLSHTRKGKSQAGCAALVGLLSFVGLLAVLEAVSYT
jgi:hypothetical protein